MCWASDPLKHLDVLYPLTLRDTEYHKSENSPKDNFCNESTIIIHKVLYN